MASYLDNALVDREDLPGVCEDTLNSIDKLDGLIGSVSETIDFEIGDIQRKRVTTKRKIEELELLRNIAENVTEKKAHLALLNYDLIDQNVKMLDQEIKLIERAMKNNGDPKLIAAIGSQFNSSSSKDNSKRRSTRLESSGNDEEDLEGVDPNEPVYCTCRRIAFGEMIACDNDECLVEWFHYSCVNLIKKPRQTWLCPSCSVRRNKKGH